MKYINGSNALREMGASWFIMYKYYEEIDSAYLKWVKCDSVGLRLSYYQNYKHCHKEWIEYVLNFANEKLLDNNKFGVTGAEIKILAQTLYDNIKYGKYSKPEVKKIPDIIVYTNKWD